MERWSKAGILLYATYIVEKSWDIMKSSGVKLGYYEIMEQSSCRYDATVISKAGIISKSE
jgi:hypothetical protein